MNLRLGSLIWLISLIGLLVKPFGPLELIQQLFLLAPLVVVPLGLNLVDPPESASPLNKVIGRLAPVGAVAALLSFWLPSGLAAAGLAGLWLVVTGLIALKGVSRLLKRGWTLAFEELAIDTGLLFLPVGGGWLVLSRYGARPFNFADLIVLLTAVHFHFAGFTALIMIGLSGRWLKTLNSAMPSFYGLVVLGAIGGTPLVAAGITFSPLLELGGAIILAVSLIGLAGLIGFVILPTIPQPTARLLLGISALSIVVGMGFSLAYAFGEYSGFSLVAIPQMARWHGLINALGFGWCGLLGWHKVHFARQ
jgi:hypothetical protein